MQSRSVIYILVASLLAVVLLIAAALTWFATQNPKQLVINAYGSSPYAALFLPRQSPLVLSLLVNPDQLEQFQESVTHDRQRTQLEWIRLRQGLVAGFDLDYDQDIQPWLGNELTVAVTTIDLDRDPSNGQQPGYLVVATTHDAPRTQEMLELFWQKQAVAGATLVFEQYQGVQIVSAQPSPSPIPAVASQPTLQVPTKRLSPLRPTVTNLATAMVGNQFLLVANHPKVLRAAINAAQARDVGLLESPTYQQALQHLTGDRVGLAIVNVANVAAWTGLSSVAPRTAIVSIGLEKQGLRLESITVPTPDPTLPTTLTAPVAALNYLPVDCLVAIASNNLQQQWQGWFAADADPDLTATLIRVWIDSLQAEWGLDMAQDIVPWVTGDYALAILRPVIPADSNQGDLSALDWVFVTQRSPATAAALEHLDQLARNQGLSIGTLQIDKQSVSTWTALATNLAKQRAGTSSLTLDVSVKGAHATVGNYELIASSIDAINRALQSPNKRSILTSDRFQTTISPLPTPNSGYVYLDWAAADNLFEGRFPILKFVKFAGSALFSHLQSVAVSSYQETTKASSRPIRKGEVFIHLGDSAS